MKKGVFLRRGARREEGMALLFALGFLALMLILGLGFVTTSLLAQKIAANNSSRAQARMFARSAAARAMVGIMLYNDQQIVSDGEKTFESYDSICSYGEVAYNKSGTANTGAVNDQLVPANPATVDSDTKGTADGSKLRYQVGTEDYSGETSRAKWMYFYDAPAGTTGRRIIGRAAFQVLPRQAGRLSLYGITGGSANPTDFDIRPHVGSTHYRWGRDIAELNLTRTKVLENWYSAVNTNNIPFKYDTLYTSYSAFFPTGTEAERTATDKKKHWVEYWFAEGKSPILKDAFPTLDPSDSSGRRVIYYNRFNISVFSVGTGGDSWYDRFKKFGKRTAGWSDSDLTSNKNTPEALDMLTAAAISYKESHTKDSEIDPSGLPFLRRIGSEPWSFESLEALRRQIAANFNDYCDSDAIPTSDVKAAEWSVTGATFPTYTGNERTLYVNEVALELSDLAVNISGNGSLSYTVESGSKNQSSVTVTKITPVVLAELVNMYDPDYGDAAAKALLNPANYEFQTSLKQLAFNIALKVDFDIKYSYRVVNNTSGSTVATGTGSTTAAVDYAEAVAKVSFAAAPVTVSSFGTLTDGYSLGYSALTSATPTIESPQESVFAGKINTALNDVLAPIRSANPGCTVTLTITGIEITRLGYKPQTDADSKIEFAPFLLKIKSEAASVAAEVKGLGVDFVRMDKAGEMALKGDPGAYEADLAESPLPASGEYKKFFQVAYIGGIEARDPRQNLNPNFTDPQKSDWNLYPRIVDGAAAGTGENPVPSLQITAPTEASAVADRVTGGKVNAYSSPAAPKYLTGEGTANDVVENDRDKETATDPAWKGDAHGQHVSTAYIRNAPMVSPWEIGLIHRGREWQTLNLKKAGGFGATADLKIKIDDIKAEYTDWSAAGTSYQNGDGAILEFVKVGEDCRCMGKVPLTLLRPQAISSSSDNSDWNGVETAYNQDIVRMLFDGIRRQTMKQFYEETKTVGTESAQGNDEITTSDAAVSGFVEAVGTLYDDKDSSGETTFRLRSQFLNTDYGAQADTFAMVPENATDAQREEIIGKTINLLTVNEVTPPNIFRVVVVAQSIKDAGGIGSAVPITKIHMGNNRELECLIGRFDYVGDDASWWNNTYFDEITGEVKALVTIERVPATDAQGNRNEDYGRMVITAIEFIE